MENRTATQIIIIGGGIAGLWLLNRLRHKGYDAILLEKSALGSGQTLASQGIIHGGLKYALNGVLSPASSAIADMPQRWRECLAGTGELDLSSCRVLSPEYYMWSNSGLRSRLKTFLGSKALHGRIDALKPTDYPSFFREATVAGTLYRLTDFVVDTGSLLQVLAQKHTDRIFRADELQFDRDDSGRVSAVTVKAAASTVRITMQQLILSAGAGNEALLQQLDIPQPQMQRRPLHMVCVRLRHRHAPFVHCIGDSFGMAPRLTVTAHPVDAESAAGEMIWYLGGELAEKGVTRSAGAQQQAARDELSTLFPWVDLSAARWGSFFIDRAEPKISNLQRPDNAFLEACGNILVTWPTKLTLCPNLGDAVLDVLKLQLTPQAGDAASAVGATLEFPGFATPPWEKALQ